MRMMKECVVCGYQPTETELPDFEDENCLQCGGQGTVQTVETDEAEEAE